MKTAKNKTARKLWKLAPVPQRPAGRDPWASPWERVHGMVVCAITEGGARSIAQQNEGYEYGAGLNTPKASCSETIRAADS